MMLVADDILQWLTAGVTSFVTIGLAEFGDKSQLVCMSLAARYVHLPVILGAGLALALLNLCAVVFGVVAVNLIPESVLSMLVCVLFAAFGLHVLLTDDDDEAVDVEDKSHRSIVITAFMLIAVAEFGDKTQITVAALSSQFDAIAVWFGATLAETLVCILGVIAGRALLKRFSLQLIHQFSGILLLLLAMASAFNGYLAIKSAS